MGHKILLADDSITIQKVVNLTFSDEGIEVVTVGNGELAVRRLNEVQPDIVLADIYMPGKSGYEVCEYIKTNPQYAHIPVLLLVGAFEPFDPTEALRVKADGHLTKPFESRALVATVNKLIASSPKPVSASTPVATPPWQSTPPDSTTTKLSPEMAARYQASFSPEIQKAEPFMASPVTPIQASPVTPIKASPVTPIQASPVFPASPVAPVQASPIFAENFAPPKPEPVFPQSSPVSNFVDKVFSFDNETSAPLATTPEETSEKMELEIDRGPIFDLDAPPPPSEPTFELELSDDTYNTSERKASATAAFDHYVDSQPLNNQTQSESSMGFSFSHNEEVIKSEEPMQENQDEEFESTQIMGSASRKELLAAYSAYTTTPATNKIEDNKEMSLDVDFSSEQPPSFEVESSVEDSNNISEDNYSYDDFSPLDLEPLEEVSYSQIQEQNNSTASTIHTTDELPAISDEYVFESTTSEIKREPLLDIEEMPASETSEVEEPNLAVGRVTSSQDVARVTETIPQLPEPIANPSFTKETPALEEVFVPEPITPTQYNEETEYTSPNPITDFNYSEPISNIPDVVSNSIPLSTEDSNPVAITNEEDPLDLESHDNLLEDESPSQFELEQAPTHYYTEALSSNYNAIAEEPLADLVTPESVSSPTNLTSVPSFETNAALEPVLDLPEFPEPPPTPVPIPNVTLAPIPVTTFIEEENLPTATDLASANSFAPIVENLPTPTIVETNLVTENPALKFNPLVKTAESDNQATITTITSIDQIPQHLIDQIVQRVIAQLSENVVREIAWEVVPDLAEILIKKQLEKKTK